MGCTEVNGNRSLFVIRIGIFNGCFGAQPIEPEFVLKHFGEECVSLLILQDDIAWRGNSFLAGLTGRKQKREQGCQEYRKQKSFIQ